MVKLSLLLSILSSKKILLMGDLMLDEYTFGEVQRISPEAPVPILKVKEGKFLPGGAGNVALNLLGLKAQVKLVGKIGQDHEGTILLDLLEKAGANVDHILFDKNYRTITKNRLIADRQQIVRIDKEEIIELSKKEEAKLIGSLDELLKDVDLVAISDYQKGFLTPSLLQAIIQVSNEKKIPVVVDPKGRDFSKYAHATMIKPNEKEAFLAANLSFSASLDEVGAILLKKTQAKYLLITRSKEGMTLFNNEGKREDFKVVVKEVIDCTGAGDTALAMICLALANFSSIKDAILLANFASGITVEHLGCFAPSLVDFAKKLLENKEYKILLKEDLFLAEEMLKIEPYTLLLLSSSSKMNMELFKVLKELSYRGKVVVLQERGDKEFLDFLASLSEVDIILKEKSLALSLVKKIAPLEVLDFSELEDLKNLETLKKLQSATKSFSKK